VEGGFQDLPVCAWALVLNERVLIHCSGLAHSAAPKEIDDLEKYLQERLPPVGDSAQS